MSDKVYFKLEKETTYKRDFKLYHPIYLNTIKKIKKEAKNYFGITLIKTKKKEIIEEFNTKLMADENEKSLVDNDVKTYYGNMDVNQFKKWNKERTTQNESICGTYFNELMYLRSMNRDKKNNNKQLFSCANNVNAGTRTTKKIINRLKEIRKNQLISSYQYRCNIDQDYNFKEIMKKPKSESGDLLFPRKSYISWTSLKGILFSSSFYKDDDEFDSIHHDVKYTKYRDYWKKHNERSKDNDEEYKYWNFNKSKSEAKFNEGLKTLYDFNIISKIERQNFTSFIGTRTHSLLFNYYIEDSIKKTQENSNSNSFQEYGYNKEGIFLMKNKELCTKMKTFKCYKKGKVKINHLQSHIVTVEDVTGAGKIINIKNLRQGMVCYFLWDSDKSLKVRQAKFPVIISEIVSIDNNGNPTSVKIRYIESREFLWINEKDTPIKEDGIYKMNFREPIEENVWVDKVFFRYADENNKNEKEKWKIINYEEDKDGRKDFPKKFVWKCERVSEDEDSAEGDKPRIQKTYDARQLIEILEMENDDGTKINSDFEGRNTYKPKKNKKKYK